MTPAKFLRAIQPEGPWALGAIEPDRESMAYVTATDDVSVKSFIRRHSNRRNLYYQINLVRPDLGDRRAKKKDISRCIALHTDIDPPDQDVVIWQKAKRRELLSWPHPFPRPSIVEFSGSGFQLIWLLREPTSDLEAVERRNYALTRALGGDLSTWNADRLLRLPGTLNYPSERKRERYGRSEPVMAELIEVDLDRRYSLSDFREAEPPSRDTEVDYVEPGPAVTLDQLREIVPSPRLRREIVRGTKPGEDRSDAVWHLAQRLLKLDVPEATVASILTDKAYKISAHCLAQKDPLRAASRAIRRQERDEPPLTGGFAEAFEQAQSEIASALGTEDTEDRYDLPLFQRVDHVMRKVYLPAPWLVDGLITLESLSIVSAEPKSAKTWLATEIALSVALGAPAFGEFGTRQSRVAYFYAEDHGASVQARWRSLAAGRQASIDDVSDRVLLCPRGKYIDLTNDEDLAWIVASVRHAGGVGLLVLDPLRDIHSAEENDSDAMIDVMRRARLLGGLLQCAVIISHHNTKQTADSSRRRPGQNIRGSGAIHGSLDCGIYLSNLDGDGVGTFSMQVQSETRSARSAGRFELTLHVRDNDAGMAEHATWSVQRAGVAGDTARTARQEQIVESLRVAEKALTGNRIIRRGDRTWVKGSKPDILRELRTLVSLGTLVKKGNVYTIADGAS